MSIIAVFGSARSPQDSAAYQQAYELGQQLALAGHAVATGGYGGTMEAVSRGAAEAGGHVIGITSDLFNPRQANRWLSEEQRTPDLHARLQRITSLADGFVALEGGIGTLTEVSLTWSLLQTEQLAPRPFILVGDRWRGLVNAIAEHTEIGSSILGLAQVVITVDNVLSCLAKWDFRNPSPVPRRPPA